MQRINPSHHLKPFPMAPYIFISEETTSEDIARYLNDIKNCGFDAFRPSCGPEYLAEGEIDFSVSDLFFQLAKEIGLQVFPHFQMGYCHWMGESPYNIDPQRCLLDEKYHQLIDAYFTAVVTRYREHPNLLGWIGIGEPGSFPEALESDPEFNALYLDWLKNQYGTLENLEHAWGFGCKLPYGHEQLTKWGGQERWAGDVFEKYRHQRDLLRFKTEFLLDKMTTCERAMMRADDQHPVLTGIHNVLANAVGKTWDFSLQTSKADGLMSSIHFGWHSWLANYEFFLPLYMQARITRDFAKGKWAIPYETTGGPNFRGADRGFNMHPRERYQMILGYLAAGLQGGGFWTWNARLTGYEAGEYALTTMQGVPSERAWLLGKFSSKMQKWQHELYDAKAEKLAAVLYSWENEAFCSCSGRFNHAESMKQDAGSRNRLGAARSLTNANIPWEFVTDGELLESGVNAYPVLIVPGMPLVSHSTMNGLAEYVKQGGTLIVDMPFGIYDEYGRFRTEGAGGEFDQLFGAYISDVYDTFNEPMASGGLTVEGNFGEWSVTTATVKATFDDGRPSIIENRLGTGHVISFAWEVCSRCVIPGNAGYEKLLVDAVMAGRDRKWACPQLTSFRRQIDNVDYYYLINSGDDIVTELQVFDTQYSKVLDVMEETDITYDMVSKGEDCIIPVSVSNGMGCWLRGERA
jgi:beta-galactosidase